MEHTSEKITTINKEDVFSLTFINNNNYKINFLFPLYHKII